MAQDGSFATSDGGGLGGASTEAQTKLDNFWTKAIEDIRGLTANDPRFKNQELPLARIKKIMKLDDDVKSMVSVRLSLSHRVWRLSLLFSISVMHARHEINTQMMTIDQLCACLQMISAEAPVLFAKAAELFITELSLRAWIHTEDNKRRTLQRNDIAMAITKYDQFDFLIDIVPRDELKPAVKRPSTANATGAIVTDATTTINPEQMQYILQLQAMQQAGAGQQIQILQPNALQGLAGAGGFTIANQPQIVQVQMPQVAQQQATTAGAQATADNGQANIAGVQNSAAGQQQVIQLQQQNHAGQPQIQMLQQPTMLSNGQGGVIHVTPQQLQQLLSRQGQNLQQPFILQTQPGIEQGAQYQLANSGQFITQTLVQQGPSTTPAVQQQQQNNDQLDETSE